MLQTRFQTVRKKFLLNILIAAEIPEVFYLDHIYIKTNSYQSTFLLLQSEKHVQYLSMSNNTGTCKYKQIRNTNKKFQPKKYFF